MADGSSIQLIKKPPEGGRWLTQDKDGWWKVFTKQPRLGDMGSWHPPHLRGDCGDYELVFHSEPPQDDKPLIIDLDECS